ncbi:FlgD Ig-like domain-containing protein [Blastococcus aurantiacus]|uniref:FlgD Ig-like domain-containing protein n=1 Tax=Blastococcus aurantiacus TaxID=1550231 RepID=A0A1G7P5P7_9ACTN|nr:Ig-like domain-containing protein [Blastococcus aurantiacus]SDF80770.1 FlgD Ig-like domain-containing protein [Blastococcus aurantiacus]
MRSITPRTAYLLEHVLRSRTRISLLAIVATGASVLGAAPALAAAPEPLPLMEAGPTTTPAVLTPVIRTAGGVIYRSDEDPYSVVRIQATGGALEKESRFPYAKVTGELLSYYDYAARAFTWRTIGDSTLQTVAVPDDLTYLSSTPHGYVARRLVPSGGMPPSPDPTDLVAVDVLDGGTQTVMGTVDGTGPGTFVEPGPLGAVVQSWSGMTSSQVYLPYDGSGATDPLVVPSGGSCRIADTALWCSNSSATPPTLTRVPLDGSEPESLTGAPVEWVVPTDDGVAFFVRTAEGNALMTWDGSSPTAEPLLEPSWGADAAGPSADGSGTLLVSRTGALGTAGIWSVPLSGASPAPLVTAPAKPRKARAVAIAPGRVAWTDNSSPDDSLWVRDISSGSGGTSAAPEQLVARNATAVALSLSGDRISYSDNTFPSPGRLRDGDTTQQLNADAGRTTLSGDRILLEGSSSEDAPVTWALRNLRTGEVAALPDARDYDLWGERLVRLGRDGAVWLSDLRTGADPVQLREATPGEDMFGDVVIAGDVVSWDFTWRAGGIGGSYQSDRKILDVTQLDEPATDVTSLGLDTVEDLSTGYAVGLDCVMNDCYPTAVSLADGGIQQFDSPTHAMAVDGNLLAFVSEGGLPSVLTLPEYADAPRLLAAPTTVTKLTGGSTWTARVVTSRVLTDCEVEIRNAAGTVVRTLPCLAPYGAATVAWDGKDGMGGALPTGSYTWQLAGATGDDELVDYDGGTAALSGTIAVGAGDTTAPVLAKRSHASGATAVPVGGSVSVTFSEPVQGVSGSTFVLKDKAGKIVPATIGYNAVTRAATLDPTAALAADARYTVALTSGVRDTAGNALVPVSWTFTTGPAPTLTTARPATNATSVAVTGKVTATFSEPVTGVSGTTFVLKDRNGKALRATVGYNATTRVATLDPVSTLAANSRYTATLTTGIRDRAGNPMVTRSWAFTTGAAPAVTARTPAVNATGVARNANVTATFSEPVTGISTRTAVLRSSSGATVTAKVTYNATRRTVTIDPHATLAARTKYGVTLTGGGTAIRDAVGDPLSTTRWSFTTGTR